MSSQGSRSRGTHASYWYVAVIVQSFLQNGPWLACQSLNFANFTKLWVNEGSNSGFISSKAWAQLMEWTHLSISLHWSENNRWVCTLSQVDDKQLVSLHLIVTVTSWDSFYYPRLTNTETEFADLILFVGPGFKFFHIPVQTGLTSIMHQASFLFSFPCVICTTENSPMSFTSFTITGLIDLLLVCAFLRSGTTNILVTPMILVPATWYWVTNMEWTKKRAKGFISLPPQTWCFYQQCHVHTLILRRLTDGVGCLLEEMNSSLFIFLCVSVCLCVRVGCPCACKWFQTFYWDQIFPV